MKHLFFLLYSSGLNGTCLNKRLLVTGFSGDPHLSADDTHHQPGALLQGV